MHKAEKQLSKECSEPSITSLNYVYWIGTGVRHT